MTNWFIALPVPAHVWPADLAATLPPTCKAFVGEDLHLTVAFLGACGADRAARAAELMTAVTAAPMTIGLGPLLALPSPKRPSALSFSLTRGHDEVAALITTYRGLFCAAADVAPDPRPALPHITVARPIRRFGAAGAEAARAFCETCAAPDVVATLDRLALYTWAPDRTVRQFIRVREVSLA